MRWIPAFSVSVLALAACLFYLLYCVNSYLPLSVRARLGRGGGWLLSAAAIALPAVPVTLMLGAVSAAVALLHLIFFLFISRLAGRIAVRLCGGAVRVRLSWLSALLLTAVYLSVGMLQAYGTVKTEYSLHTDKRVGNLRVAMLADAHIGSLFDGRGFGVRLAGLQEQSPDIVVVVGDFVDEGTTREDMESACRALGALRAPYGVWYVFGNHDKGIYSGSPCGYSVEDFVGELEENGVGVLEDRAVLIDDRFYLIGRSDESEQRYGGRADMRQLTEGLNPDIYSIVLDHQPHDYISQAESGVDLVLSGHTHGGQLIPLGSLMRLMSINGTDNVYGWERRGNTDFIVTSGISDWKIKFKTGCRSEYVIIDIEGR